MNYAELRSRVIFHSCAACRAQRSCCDCRYAWRQGARGCRPQFPCRHRPRLRGVAVTGVRLIVGCRLDLEDFPSVLVYPMDRAAYGRLCRLLTVGKARAGKGKCSLFIDDVAAWSEGLVAVLVTDKPSDQLPDYLQRMKAIFGDRAYCALTRRFRPDDAAHLHDIATMASQARVPTVVTGTCFITSPACGRCKMSSPASGSRHR